jgi:hypothetical protein
MNYERTKQTRARIEKEIQESFRTSERLDKEANGRSGFEKQEDMLPEDLIICEKGLTRIKEAMEAVGRSTC